MDELCKNHKKIFNKNNFKYKIVNKNGKRIKKLKLQEYEIKDGESKYEIM